MRVSLGPLGSGLRFDTDVEADTTMQVTKKVPPRRMEIDLVASGSDAVPAEAAAIALKTSGAPFPKANSVTPASESERPQAIVRCSRAGDRYSSAVEARR